MQGFLGDLAAELCQGWRVTRPPSPPGCSLQPMEAFEASLRNRDGGPRHGTEMTRMRGGQLGGKPAKRS